MAPTAIKKARRYHATNEDVARLKQAVQDFTHLDWNNTEGTIAKYIDLMYADETELPVENDSSGDDDDDDDSAEGAPGRDSMQKTASEQEEDSKREMVQVSPTTPAPRPLTRKVTAPPGDNNVGASHQYLESAIEASVSTNPLVRAGLHRRRKVFLCTVEQLQEILPGVNLISGGKRKKVVESLKNLLDIDEVGGIRRREGMEEKCPTGRSRSSFKRKNKIQIQSVPPANSNFTQDSLTNLNKHDPSQGKANGAPPPLYEIRVLHLLTSTALLSPSAKNINPDLKARLLFDMIDTDNSGVINRDDILHAIQHSALENAMHLTEEELEIVVDALMKRMDVDAGGDVCFEEFKKTLDVGRMQLDFVKSRKVAEGFDLRLEDGDDSGDDDSDSDMKDGVKGSRSTLQGWSIPRRARVYISLHKRSFFFAGVYIALNIMMFFLYLRSVYTTVKIDILGWGTACAKGMAGVLYVNVPLSFLSISRTLITFLRGLPFAHLMPLDHSTFFHKMVGYVIAGAATAHVIGHLSGTVAKTTTMTDENFAALNSIIIGHKFDQRLTYAEMLFTTLPGLTGIIATLSLIVLVTLSIPKIRTQNYELFWYSHHVYFIFAASLLIHGTWKWIQFPHMFMYLSLPLGWYLIERLLRIYRGKFVRYEPTLTPLADRAIKVSLKRIGGKANKSDGGIPTSQRRPGQYVYVKFPKLSKHQWHPYTLASSPLEDKLEVYIRSNGNWTDELVKRSERSAKSSDFSPAWAKDVEIDGPFGAPAEHWDRFENIMLIGAGIGVTPFASILRDLEIRMDNLNANQLGSIKSLHAPSGTRLRRVDFYWVNRSRLAFSWFQDLLREIEREDRNGV
ncbi:hypothetical protein HK097_005318, partial [Rhizophlyctis rosea]